MRSLHEIPMPAKAALAAGAVLTGAGIAPPAAIAANQSPVIVNGGAGVSEQAHSGVNPSGLAPGQTGTGKLMIRETKDGIDVSWAKPFAGAQGGFHETGPDGQ